MRSVLERLEAEIKYLDRSVVTSVALDFYDQHRADLRELLEDVAKEIRSALHEERAA